MSETQNTPVASNMRQLRLVFLLVYLLFAFVPLLFVPGTLQIGVGAGKGDESALGHFYAAEQNGQREYRWTKEVSRINVPRLSYYEQVTLFLDGSRPAGFTPSDVDVYVNGQLASTIPAAVGPITHTFSYHDLSSSSELAVELRTRQTFYPSDKDYRELGIVYYGMATQAAAGPFGWKWPPLLVAVLWLLLAACLLFILPLPRYRYAGALLLLPLVIAIWVYQPANLAGWLAIALLIALPLTVFRNRKAVEAALAGGLDWLAAWRMWRVTWVRLLSVPLFYLLATVIFTWPYVLKFGSAVPGWPMDNFNFMYKIWWVSNSMFGNPPPGSSIIFSPNVYYPIGFNLAQGELTPANTLATIPITATLGPTVSYNLLVFASYVLSGWAMYLLVRYLLSPSPLAPPPIPVEGSIVSISNGVGQADVINEASTEVAQQASELKVEEGKAVAISGVVREQGGPPPAPTEMSLIPHTSYLIPLLIGLAFTFVPYRVNHMVGHLQMLGTQWLPLTFLFMEKMLRGRRWQDGAWAGLFFALCCWEAWYYAAIMGLFVGIYLVVRWWQLRGYPSRAHIGAPLPMWFSRPQFTIHNSLFIIAFVGVVGALVLPFALPYLTLREGNTLAYSVKAANGSSALLSDYFIPSQLQPIWGDFFKTKHTATLNLTEYNLWPGAAMYLLIALGVWAGWKWRGRLGQFPFALYLGMGLLAVVLSFGLRYDLSGELGRFNHAWRGENWQVPLPGRILYEFVPLFSSIRAWARFGVIVIFALFVVAGLGLVWLLAQPRLAKYRNTVIAGLAVLIMIDFWATPYTWGYSHPTEQPLDVWLKQQPTQTVVAMMPFERATRDGMAMWASAYHGQPIAYGYETFMPNDYQINYDKLESFPDAASLDVLKAWGVRYVAVGSRYYDRYWPEKRDAIAATSRLKYVDKFYQSAIWDGDVGLFDVRPDIEWHCVSDEVYLYALQLPSPQPSPEMGAGANPHPSPLPKWARGRLDYAADAWADIGWWPLLLAGEAGAGWGGQRLQGAGQPRHAGDAGDFGVEGNQRGRGGGPS